MQSKVEINRGTILLAEPFMLDPGFRRSVVLLCDHSPEGTVGFILNKPLDMEVSGLIRDFPEYSSGVFYGGPVATDTLHYLHTIGHILDESIEIGNGVFWGGNFKQLKALIAQEMVTPETLRFFVGYSGWSGGQLLDELDYGSWITAKMDINYLFNSEYTSLWNTILKHKGDNFSIIAEMPESTSWN
jgi:putative transcriptional regulator